MILVTGATGNVGRNLVHLLHTTGRHVRALSRHAREQDFPAGVEVVAGDMTDRAVLDTALHDVEAAFLFPLFGRITPFLDVAVKHRLDRLVMLSSSAVIFDEPGWIGHQHQLLEDEVRSAGIASSFVRPDVFMANDLAWAASIRASRVVHLAYPDACGRTRYRSRGRACTERHEPRCRLRGHWPRIAHPSRPDRHHRCRPRQPDRTRGRAGDEDALAREPSVSHGLIRSVTADAWARRRSAGISPAGVTGTALSLVVRGVSRSIMTSISSPSVSGPRRRPP